MLSSTLSDLLAPPIPKDRAAERGDVDECCDVDGLADADAPLPDVPWNIRDLLELEDETAPPVEEVADLLAGDFDAVEQAFRGVQRAQALLLDAVERARADFSRSDATVLAYAPQSPLPNSEAMERALVSEIATRVRLSDRAVLSLIHEAETLTHGLPQTMDSLRHGRTAYQNARTAAREAWSLPSETHRSFDEGIMAKSRTQPPSRFRASARRLRERLHPESIDARKKSAFEDRRVQVGDEQDGMAWIGFTHSADVIRAIDLQARVMAGRTKAQEPEDDRTLAQVEADSLADLLLTGLNAGACVPSAAPRKRTESGGDVAGYAEDGRVGTPHESSDSNEAGDINETGDINEIGESNDDAAFTRDAEGASGADDGERVVLTRRQLASLRPGVVITVPVLSLLGFSAEPAEIEGYGPIDHETAQRIIGEASGFTRVLTDPTDGRQLAVDPHHYRLSESLKRSIRVRDGTCGFPDCAAPAKRCDIDHILAWEDGGLSTPENLTCLCRKHHMLKHATTWQVTRAPDGSLLWTSPSTVDRRRGV